jgi:hypothetical protein
MSENVDITLDPIPSTIIGSGATSHPISFSASFSDLSGGNSKESTIEGMKKQRKNNNLLNLLSKGPIAINNATNTKSI